MSQTHELTAFYDDRAEADAAVRRVTDAGVPAGNVRIVEGNDPAANAGTRPREDRSFMDKLGDFFMPEEDRHTFAEGLHRGGYVVAARVSADRKDHVAELLDHDSGIDLDQRSDEWRKDGWAGFQAGTGSDETIEVAEENLRVGKRDVSHGRVKIRSYVVEEQVSEDVTLTSETVEVDRHAVDRAVTDADAAFRERTIEVEETAQEAVVSKEARVVEEIDVNKAVETETETVSDTVRRTEVDIDDNRR